MFLFYIILSTSPSDEIIYIVIFLMYHLKLVLDLVS